MTFPAGETVTIQTAGTTTDPYSGDPTEDWDNPTTRTVNGVGVANGGTAEPVEIARNEVDSDFDLFFPADDPVTAQDRVVVRGLTCDVVGRPFRWSNPFTGWTPGLVVKVKVREG